MAKFLDTNGLSHLWAQLKTIFVKEADISTVAKSGKYSDLTGTPTNLSDFTNDAGFTTNVGTITGIKMNGVSKGTSGVVDLGTIITDVSGKQDNLTAQIPYTAKGSATKVPQITTNALGQVTAITEVTITQPTVNNATLTIQKNGETQGTWTANSGTAKTVNIAVPTKVSELLDAADYAKKSDMTNVYKYKGSVKTYSNLPQEGLTAGDVYNVESNGKNYAWTGTSWDDLGGVFEIETISNDEIDTIIK